MASQTTVYIHYSVIISPPIMAFNMIWALSVVLNCLISIGILPSHNDAMIVFDVCVGLYAIVLHEKHKRDV